MFAFGFSMVVIGWLVINILGGDTVDSPNTMDYFGATVFLIGLVVLCLAFIVLLWNVMP
jgi:hypothetical protein